MQLKFSRHKVAGLLLAAAFTGIAGAAHAQSADPIENNVLIEADEVVYDRSADVVTATGNVEITSDERVLLADSIVYDRNTKTVTANGNVSLMQPDGQVLFADNIVLSDDLADGVGNTVRLLLEENARLAANAATRSAGNRTALNKAVYTVCDVCADKPDANPLWQIKSYRVVHDKQKQRVEYQDAFLEFFGVPVFYTPYFSHPDPTVKRQTGFLTPSISFSEDFGTTFRTPFFFNLAPNYDFTFKPRWQTEVGNLYAGEFRHHVGFGQYNIDLSGTWPREDDVDGNPIDDFRGHLFVDGEFDITQKTVAGLDVKLTTDDTFLRRYDIFEENDLISTAYVETIDDRNYARIEGFYFEGLLESDDQDTIPYVVPLIDGQYYLDSQVAGGQVQVDVNALNLQRTEGTSFQRLSADMGWELSRTAHTGEQFGAFIDVRGDIYVVEDDGPAFTGQDETRVETRFLPAVGLEYRWPWISEGETSAHVIQPIVQAIYSPNNGNPNAIPNDDSLNIDFETTHLFDRNRSPGLDRFEDGARLNYGLQYSFLADNGGEASLLVGQSYRFDEVSAFEAGSGLDDRQSDVVGRVQISPGPYLDLVSRFRVDPRNGELQRTEVSMNSRFNLFKNRGVSLSANYVFLDSGLSTEDIDDAQEILAAASYNFADNWWIAGGIRYDVEQNQTISDEVGITYQDECFLFTLAFEQSFIRDRDVEPRNSISFRIQLVTLGDVGGSTGISSASSN